MGLFKSSDAAIELARFAGKWLGHSAMAGHAGETLIPFGVIQRKALIGRAEDIQVFQNPTFEEGVEAAFRWFDTERGSGHRVLVAFDGYMTINGIKRDAVIAYVADDKSHIEMKITAPYRSAAAPGGYESYLPTITLPDHIQVESDRYAQLIEGLRSGRNIHPMKEVQQIARWIPLPAF